MAKSKEPNVVINPKNDILRWPFLACSYSGGIYGPMGETTALNNHDISLKIC